MTFLKCHPTICHITQKKRKCMKCSVYLLNCGCLLNRIRFLILSHRTKNLASLSSYVKERLLQPSNTGIFLLRSFCGRPIRLLRFQTRFLEGCHLRHCRGVKINSCLFLKTRAIALVLKKREVLLDYGRDF